MKDSTTGTPLLLHSNGIQGSLSYKLTEHHPTQSALVPIV